MRALALALTLAGCATPAPVPAPAQGQRAHYMEIVGNYHGRDLRLALNGAVVAQGYQHLLPPGVAWREDLPATDQVEITLWIAPCEPFTRTIRPSSETPTLIVADCDIRLVQ